MDDGWRERLFQAIDADERSDRAISLAAGLGPNFIGQMRGTLNTAPKKPNIEYVRKLAEALGTDLASILGQDNEDAERRLRSALLAYGVDGKDLGRAVSAVKLFTSPHSEQLEQDLPDDPPEPASRPRAKAPSR